MRWGPRWSEEALIAVLGPERSRPLLGLNQPPDEAILEAPFQAKIRRLARSLGYRVYHTHDSRGSDKGFPDLTMVRPVTVARSEHGETGLVAGRLIFAEIKKRGEKPTYDQEVWLSLLRHSIAEVEAYTWEPKDWPTVVEILTRTGPYPSTGDAPAP